MLIRISFCTNRRVTGGMRWLWTQVTRPSWKHIVQWYGPLARYVKLRVRMRRECRERFPRHRRWAIPTCITARASRTCRDACRDRQLSVSFEIGGGEKRSRHSRRMRNLQFYVSGKRPMPSKHNMHPITHPSPQFESRLHLCKRRLPACFVKSNALFEIWK